MSRYNETRAALLDLLKTLGTEPISLYAIGVPLVDRGCDQNTIANALFALANEGAVEFLSGNRVRALKIS